MDGSLADKVTSTACQDWAVFIVSSLKENEASTMIRNIIAKTEYFIFGRPPNPPPPPNSKISLNNVTLLLPLNSLSAK